MPNKGRDKAAVPNIIQDMWSRMDKGQLDDQDVKDSEEENEDSESSDDDDAKATESQDGIWLGPKIPGVEIQGTKRRITKARLEDCLCLLFPNSDKR